MTIAKDKDQTTSQQRTTTMMGTDDVFIQSRRVDRVADGSHTNQNGPADNIDQRRGLKNKVGENAPVLCNMEALHLKMARCRTAMKHPRKKKSKVELYCFLRGSNQEPPVC